MFRQLTVCSDDCSWCQVSRLREYQGVDPRFDVIARQYHEIVKVIWLSVAATSLPYVFTC
jgi:hypothetical protein